MIGCSSGRQGLRWEPFSSNRLDEAARARTPVVIEFAADWCAPCAELDRTTFRDAGVIKAAARHVMLKADVTDLDSRQNATLREQFKVTALPTFVFMRADGRENADARLGGFVTPQEFVRAMEASTR
jgi:thiol:disulfide interchange protein DsbD